MWRVLVLVCFPSHGYALDPVEPSPTCYEFTGTGEHQSFSACQAERAMWHQSPWLDRYAQLLASVTGRPGRLSYECKRAGVRV